MGTESWEWGGMGTRKSFPHISTVLASIVVKNVFFLYKNMFFMFIILCMFFFSKKHTESAQRTIG